MYTEGVLSNTFPRDRSASFPLPTPFSSVLLLGLGPTLLPSPFRIHLWNMGGKGILHILKLNLGKSTARVGSLALNPYWNFLFPVSCSPILEFCLRQRVPCSRITRGEVIWSILAAVTLISLIKSWPWPFPNFHFTYYFAKEKRKDGLSIRWKPSFYSLLNTKSKMVLSFCTQACIIYLVK